MYNKCQALCSIEAYLEEEILLEAPLLKWSMSRRCLLKYVSEDLPQLFVQMSRVRQCYMSFS